MKYFERERTDRCKVPNLQSKGWTLFKTWGMWDWCPHYRHEKTGKIIYLHNDGSGFRLMNGAAVLADLRENWRPASDEDRNWMLLSMESYFGSAS